MAFEFDQTTAAPVEGFDSGTAQPVKPSGVIRRLADTGLALGKGIIGAPEAVVGVADLVTGGRAGRAVESAGVRFKDAKQVLTDLQSPEQHAADAEVQQAEGFVPTIRAMVRNPSTIVNAVAESAPSMIAGGAVARGALAVAPKLGAIGAGALGEGVVAAGQNAEQVRQETEGGLLPDGAAPILAGSGALTAGISRLSGGIANKLGIGDVNTMLAAGKMGVIGEQAVAKGAQKGVIRKMAEGAAVEGGLQELPQSMQEQAAQNLALGRPADEGIGAAAAQGLLVGGVTGAVAGPFTGKPAAPAAPPAGPIARAAALALPAPVVRVDSEGGARVDGAPPPVTDELAANVVGRAPIVPPPAALALPPPTVTVDSQGNARAPGQLPPEREPGPRETGAMGLGRNSEVPTPAAPGQPAIPFDNSPTGTLIAGQDGVRAERKPEAVARENAARIQDGDITADSGKPFKVNMGAARAARQAGPGYQVVKVDGGFVARRGGDVTDVVAKPQGSLAPAPLQSEAAAAPSASPVQTLTGQQLDSRWTAFAPESGTKNIPRAEMPQVKAENRGALVNFLSARGITHEPAIEVPAADLKPTQAEFSQKKVRQAADFAGGDRSILVSSDGHVLDGHHQWLAKLDAGLPVKVIRLNAPIDDLVSKVREFPSAETAGAITTSPAAPAPVPAGNSTPAQGQPGADGAAGANGPAVQPDATLKGYSDAQATQEKPGLPVSASAPSGAVAGTSDAAAERGPAGGVAVRADTIAAAPDTSGPSGPSGPAGPAGPSLKGPGDAQRQGEVAPAAGAGPAPSQPGANRKEPAAVPPSPGDGQAASVTPADILNADGKPFRNRLAAGAALKKAGPGHEVAAVAEGGFVVRALPKPAAAPAEAKALSVGITPGNAEPVTVKNGIVHIGKSEAINFDTGEPVKVAAGAGDAQVKEALRAAGALSRRQKFFGGAISQSFSPEAKFSQGATTTTETPARGITPSKPAIKSGEKAESATTVESLGKTGGKGLAGGKSARSRAREANPFKAFLGEHGIASTLASEFAPGLKERRAAMVQGYGPIFRKTGKQIDVLAQAAVEEGFLLEADEGQLYELVNRVMRGERVIAQYAPGVAEQEMQAQMDALDGEEPVAGLSDLSENELDVLDDVPWDEPSNTTTEAAMRALGFTDQEISDAIAKKSGSAQADRASSGQSDEAAAGQAPAGSGSRKAAQGTAEGLTPEPDYFAELFGTPNEQAARQEKFLADASSKQADIQRIRGAIATERRRAEAEHADWSGRTYKKNSTQVDLRGDGPSNQASMSIGAINESRRRNALDALSQEMGALEKLASMVATESGAERMLTNMTDMRDRADAAVASGNFVGMDRDAMFESMLLEDLKFRGPGGKGSVTSNGLSKAILKALPKPTEGLSSPSPAQVVAAQDRAANAPALDAKAQIDREAAAQTLTQQDAPEQRADTSGDMFAREKAQAELDKKNAGKPKKDDGTTPLFKRASFTMPNASGSMQVQDIRKALAPALAKLKIPYAIHQTTEEAGLAIGQDIPDDAKGFHWKGKVHLIAENLINTLEAQETLWHEVNHAGLNVAYGTGSVKYENALRALSMQNRNIREAAKAWMDRYGEEDYAYRIANGATPERAMLRTKLQAVDEALAELSGRKGEKINGLAKFIAKVQEFLRSIGLHELAKWLEGKTDAEALSMILGARAAVMTDTGSQEKGEMSPAFSKDKHARTVQVDGKRYPAENSKGQPIHPTFEGQKNFWKWAKDTKAVDATGRPIVLYHGTSKTQDGEAFTTFDTYGSEYGLFGQGSYFTDNPNLAGSYTKKGRGNAPTVYPAYLSIKNPIDMDGPAAGRGTAWLKAFPDVDFDAYPPHGGTNEAYYRSVEEHFTDEQMPKYEASEAIQDGLRRMGHDGITHHGGVRFKTTDGTSDTRHQVYIAFDPEQIKSVFNRGTFDPEDSNIQFARAGTAPAFGNLTPAQEQALKNVGGIQPKQTVADRFNALRSNLGLKVMQGLFDQFAPIKTLDDKAYLLARMSKASEGTMEAALLYGKPFLRDGVADVDMKDGGFAKVLASLKGEHDRFLWWVAAQRAERLKAEGRENLFTDADISGLKTLNTGTFADGSGRTMVYANALKELNAYNEAALKLAKDSGLIDNDAYEAMRYDPYVPFYRLIEDGDEMPKFKGGSGLTNQQAFKKLKGGTDKLNNDLLQNLLLNWNHLFAAAAKNRAGQAAMKAAVDQAVAYPVPGGAPAAKGSLKIMEDGKAVHYQVEDPYLMEAISSLHYVPSPLVKPLAAMKNILTLGVTANPSFKIRNLMRDSIAAIAQADLGYNPLKNVADGWKATNRDSQTYASMLAAGGIMKFGTTEDTSRVRRQIEKLGGELLDKEGWGKLTGQMASVWEAYQEFGDRGENVNRAALYEKLVKQGKSHAEAAFMARDLMDFSMTGQWGAVRFLAQTVPFLNARLVGLNRLGRAAVDNPKRFATVTGAVMLASVALMLAYRDDEDWKRREDFDRDATWWFKIGDKAFRIPKPFEIGAMGTLAERTAELMIEPEMTGKRFGQRVSAMLFQTFNFDPTPQAFKPLLDVYANKDSFTGRPIEGMVDQRLRPQDRVGPRTSEVARLLGQLGLPDPAQLAKGEYAPLSPKQVDFLLRGYFGWFGTVAQTVPDFSLRPMMDRGERPAMKMRDVFLAGNFVETLPSGSSRYVSILYEQARDIERAYASYHAALKSGDQEQAGKIMEAEGPKIRAFPQIERVKRAESMINAQIRRIEASKELSAAEKRDRITVLEARREKIAKPVTAVQ